MVVHIWEAFTWCLRGTVPPLQPLLEHYWELCPNFVSYNTAEATRDFQVPELVHTIFYAMVVNDALELGILDRNMVPF